MVDVFFTIDVEIWCDGWEDIDAKFPDAFQRYIYGPHGQGGLPQQLQVLSDYGLIGVCFVEPLFAGRFGHEPLCEVVDLIQGAGHEVQLHLHTEWVDESLTPLLQSTSGKRQHLSCFNLTDQTSLIRVGAEWLQRAGAPPPTAFRAGSFALNVETLEALADNRIFIDCSYNASMLGPKSGLCPELLGQARQFGQVLELPMTVYSDGRGLRHTQLTACSWAELKALLWQAVDLELDEVVLLSHNFELLTPGARRVDPIVVRRLSRLVNFFDRHRDCFRVRGLRSPPPKSHSGRPPCLSSPLWRTGLRMAEQAWRLRYSR